MNKAILELDPFLNIITLKYKRLNLSFGCSPRITKISEITLVDNGYIVIQTNKGEEYIDIEGAMTTAQISEDYIAKVMAQLSEVTLENIELRNIDSLPRFNDGL